MLAFKLKFKFWRKTQFSNLLAGWDATAAEAETPIFKTRLKWEKQQNIFSGSIMHCKTLALKVIPWTNFVLFFFSLIDSTILQLVTSLMFTSADHLDSKGWRGTKLQQFHLNSNVNLLTQPCTLVGVFLRFIMLQDSLFTQENGVLISTECASWEIPWITK